MSSVHYSLGLFPPAVVHADDFSRIRNGPVLERRTSDCHATLHWSESGLVWIVDQLCNVLDYVSVTRRVHKKNTVSAIEN